MGRKCSVLDCLSDSGRPEDIGVTFHKIPMHSDIRPKWMSLCRIPGDKKDTKVIYICSRHFLRADFCNFKGKKYMLRQGVLPSVFPWSKSKSEGKPSKRGEGSKKKVDAPKQTEEVKEEPQSPTENSEESREIKTEVTDEAGTSTESKPVETAESREEILKSPTQSTTIEQRMKSMQTSYGTLNFAPNTRIEALDFNNIWYPARIVEVDFEENEVLIHFEKYSSKYDEWICMNSARLRPLQPIVKKPGEAYAIGERCMASWSDSRKFPATVTKILDKDLYEVLFDDGFVKVLKVHRISKAEEETMQSSPLFDPAKGSKQERRDRKRKLNVAALFGKRARTDLEEPSASAADENDTWYPSWENGQPVGIPSKIQMFDGPKRSVIVPDPRLPSEWQKHLTKRVMGHSAGKWDTVILSPGGRKFRNRSEIRIYLEEHKHLNFHESMFDFTMYRRQRRARKSTDTPPPITEEPPLTATDMADCSTEEVPETGLSLKILLVDNTYKCPIEGCGKNFRRENLAQMHVKHYHPQYTKFLDSTPNVADLAYARTVGESLDKSPGPEKPVKTAGRPSAKHVAPKVVPRTEVDAPKVAQLQKTKDSEIIKLLSGKPTEEVELPKFPPGLPSNMYPEIKLKDLLNKSEGIPNRDDLNLKSLSASTARPTGIKTLLPVVRNVEPKKEPNEFLDPEVTIKTHAVTKLPVGRPPHRRRRLISENVEMFKPVEIKVEPTSDQNVIIEGGEVIKIVQMKSEEIINCTCGIAEEDGLMIQCELCLCWQHAYCNNIERENQVPEKYVCYICQNPVRQRLSRKYYHDQDWLKYGSLPSASYHCKDDKHFAERFDKLRKSHDLTGGLVELKDYVHTLRAKIKIAESKNHPKLYLWSKLWEKLSLPEKIIVKTEIDQKTSNVDHQYTKNEFDGAKPEGESLLLSILKNSKDELKLKDDLTFPKLDLNTLIGNNLDQITVNAPIIPQPEAAIDSADCLLNLLDHIAHSQTLVENRLNDFDQQIMALENASMVDEIDENYPRTRQTLQMIMRDLCTLKEFGQSTTL